jgi:hypothetical protein
MGEKSEKNDEQTKRGGWDIFKKMIKLLGVVTFAIVLSVIGSSINTVLKKEELHAKCIEVATGVLHEAPFNESSALKDGTVDFLRKDFPVPIYPDNIAELKNKPLLKRSPNFRLKLATKIEENPPPVTIEENPPPVGSEENPPPVGSEENPPPVGSEENPPPVSSEEYSPPVGIEENPPPLGIEENPPPVGLEESDSFEK